MSGTKYRGDSDVERGRLSQADGLRLNHVEAANRRAAHILEQMSDAFVALDANWRYTFVNDKAAQIFGRKRDDLIGKHIWTEFPEGVGQPFYHAYHRAMAERAFVYLEEYYAPYDRWFENRIYPAEDGISIFFHDITDRKRAEESLKASEERLRLAISGARLGTWHWNIATGELLWSDRCLEIFGIPAGTAMSYERFLAALHPEDRARADDAVQRALREHGEYAIEVRCPWPDGTVHWAKSLGLAYYDDRGQPTQMQGVALDITERKRSEEALRESEERVTRAVESSNTGLWDWDLRTNQVYFSPIWKRQIGYEDHEIGNAFEEWRSRVHPEDLEHAESLVRKYLEKPWPNFENEFRFRHKDGSYRWILAKASLNHDREGRPERMLGSHLDITDHKRVEEALREREQIFEYYLEHSPAAIAMLDRDMRYLAVSKRWRDDYRLGNRPLIGLSHYEVFPEVPKRWVEIHRRCLHGAIEKCEEDPFLRADGATDWLRWEVRPWRKLDGKIGGIIIFSEDITKRKLAELALSESEERFRALVEQAHDAFFVHDADGRFRDVNRRACESLGYEKAELVTMRIRDIEQELDEDRVLETLANARPGDFGTVVGRHVRKDGGSFPVEVSWSCLDLGGEKVFLDLVRDITERQRSEQALRDSEFRLRSLSQQLLDVQEAERASIARELHDEIGQALTAMKLAAQWLARRTDRESGEAERLAECVALADRALAQTRSLTLELRPPQLDQLGLAAALRDQTERVASSAGFAARFACDADDAAIDKPLATTIFRIAQEALTNCARHAGARNVQVELRGRESALSIAVSDDGRGFDLDAKRRSAIKGVSMGLLGMEERAALAGGTLRIATHPGGGTRVEATFALPPAGGSA